MQINEEELKYVLGEIVEQDDIDWLVEQFLELLEDYRSSVLTTYNK